MPRGDDGEFQCDVRERHGKRLRNCNRPAGMGKVGVEWTLGRVFLRPDLHGGGLFGPLKRAPRNNLERDCPTDKVVVQSRPTRHLRVWRVSTTATVDLSGGRSV